MRVPFTLELERWHTSASLAASPFSGLYVTGLKGLQRSTGLTQQGAEALGECTTGAIKPTVSLDVISLVASSCGYYRGHIEHRAAH